MKRELATIVFACVLSSDAAAYSPHDLEMWFLAHSEEIACKPMTQLPRDQSVHGVPPTAWMVISAGPLRTLLGTLSTQTSALARCMEKGIPRGLKDARILIVGRDEPGFRLRIGPRIVYHTGVAICLEEIIVPRMQLESFRPAVFGIGEDGTVSWPCVYEPTGDELGPDSRF